MQRKTKTTVPHTKKKKKTPEKMVTTLKVQNMRIWGD